MIFLLFNAIAWFYFLLFIVLIGAVVIIPIVAPLFDLLLGTKLDDLK